MNTRNLILSALLVMLCSVMNARTAVRCFDPATQTFCVRVDGRLFTVKDYDNWLFANYPTAYLSDTVMPYWMKRHRNYEPSTDSKNFRYFSFATRTMQWGDKLLRAWVIIDDQGRECSHWAFAGSDSSEGGYWLLYDAESDKVFVTLFLCADTACWYEGWVDKNGILYEWDLDDEGNLRRKLWNWKLFDE